ncbi:MAG: glycosyltransferase family 2 protein [Candidatus Micrarchaeota archaeon]
MDANKDKSVAPQGFARTNLRLAPRKSILSAGLIVLSIFVLLALSFSYRAIFIAFNIFSLFVFVCYLVMWFEGANQEHLPPKPQKWPAVSIIIPSFNSGHTIFDCIEACKKLRYEGSKEIIVVDDGSSDGSYEKLKGAVGIKLLRKEKNAGKASALNLGISHANGDIIANVDSDTYPEAHALENAVRYFVADDKVGAVVLFICVANPRGLLAKMQEIEYWVAFGFFFKANSFMDSLYVTPGPTSLYRRKVFDQIGGFDEKNITEDMEMALRMQKAGWKLRTYHSAIAYTEVPTTLRSLLRQRIRWFRGGLMNLLKYHELIFNPRFSLLGLFVMPAILISGTLTALFIFWMLIANLQHAINFAIAAAANPDIFAIALTHLRMPSILSIDSMFIFALGALILWFYFLSEGIKLSRKKFGISNILPLIMMITFFPLFTGIAYFISYAFELSGREYHW